MAAREKCFTRTFGNGLSSQPNAQEDLGETKQ
jgi:hypothetical protein